jgi:hypothetical protein
VSFQGFSLIPADDDQSTPADDLAAAAAGAVAIPDQITPAPQTLLLPFGNSWRFDWATGQFIRIGQGPETTANFDSLGEWCQMAIHVARYSSPLLSDTFGMEEPDDIIGEFGEGEALTDWQSALIEALMVHDRIASIENIELDWDPSTGILTIQTMDIITDTDETVQVSDITLQAGEA